MEPFTKPLLMEAGLGQAPVGNECDVRNCSHTVKYDHSLWVRWPDYTHGFAGGGCGRDPSCAEHEEFFLQMVPQRPVKSPSC